MADSTFEMDSCICGHHVCKTVWTTVIGEILSCEREEDNLHDLFAVRVTKPGETQTIGHLPRLISSTASLFIQRGGTIQCTVAGGDKDILQI